MFVSNIGLLFLCVLLVERIPQPAFAANPNPPKWPSSVFILDPSQPSTTQQIVDRVFAENGGSTPAFNGQWSSSRYALLFKPGTHNVSVEVGFYTSVMGLGSSPFDTRIGSVNSPNGDQNSTAGALCNFWRSAENFVTAGSANALPSDRGRGALLAGRFAAPSPTPSMIWAVSQAAPLRRVVVEGDLQLWQFNSGACNCAGYSSGGFMADSIVTGTVLSGTQQQWFSRNVQLGGGWSGGVWNMAYMGCSGQVPAAHCSTAGGSAPTAISALTPLIAEKPYLTQNATGHFFLMLPPVETLKLGSSNFSMSDLAIDFAQVYVATPADTSATMSERLAAGDHLLLSPGIYNLTEPIVISRPGSVVLGIGFPTLVASNLTASLPVLHITPSATSAGSASSPGGGVRIAGLLLQAGPMNSPSLLQWDAADSSPSSPPAPSFIQDVFARVGGTNDPSLQQMRAQAMMRLEASHVVLDHSWLWRADHGVTGELGGGVNPVPNGLVVLADDVLAYGLQVEHTTQDLVQWNGTRGGQIFFFQSELPYDATQEDFGAPGYCAIRVADQVEEFLGSGLGAYAFFNAGNVTVENAFVTGAAPAVQLQTALTVCLGEGSIAHVADGQGAEATNGANFLQYLC
jgi:hypothetical protein